MTGSDRGENARFQMFSKEGNDAVAAMCDEIVRMGACGQVTRIGLGREIKHQMRAVAAAGYDEVYDTEPEWAIVDEINERLCGALMWLPITRDW